MKKPIFLMFLCGLTAVSCATTKQPNYRMGYKPTPPWLASSKKTCTLLYLRAADGKLFVYNVTRHPVSFTLKSTCTGAKIKDTLKPLSFKTYDPEPLVGRGVNCFFLINAKDEETGCKQATNFKWEE